MRFEDVFDDYEKYEEQNDFFVKKGSIIVAGFYEEDRRIKESRNLFVSECRIGETFFCDKNALLLLLDDATFDTQECYISEETMVRVFSFEKGMTLFLPTHETYVKVMSHGK